MTDQVPSTRGQNRLILLLIVAVFVGPIVVAWLYVSGIFDWHSRGLVNQGRLISPPIDLTKLEQHSSVQVLYKLKPSEWAMVFIAPGGCEETCTAVLDKMLTIRELLGEGGVRVSVHAIASSGKNSERHSTRIHLDPAGTKALTAEIRTRFPQVALPLIALIDWRHQVMMYYPSDTPPQFLQKDLKRLLRASKIR